MPRTTKQPVQIAQPTVQVPPRKTRAARKKSMEPMEHQIGQDRPRDMPSTGKARIEPSEIEIVDGPHWKEKAKILAFMEEELEVMVHESTDPHAELVVYVANGGRNQYFVRGLKQTVKRKFVEILARAKRTTYRQEHYKDDNGYDAIRNIPSTALRYPFSVIRDPNPIGAEWVQKILAEP